MVFCFRCLRCLTSDMILMDVLQDELTLCCVRGVRLWINESLFCSGAEYPRAHCTGRGGYQQWTGGTEATGWLVPNVNLPKAPAGGGLHLLSFVAE